MNLKIKKYIKLKNNKYKIILENNETIILYEDVILNFNLLLKKEIEDLEEIKEYNNKYALYDKTIIFINKKIRTVKEIESFLNKYTNNQEDINNIINKLKNNNYINDNLYIKSYINDKFNLTLDGPIKIKNNLLKLGFNSLEIDEYLNNIFTKEIISNRINKYINKQLKSNNKSLYIFKNKVLIYLINLGYKKEDILINLNNISFDEKDFKEKEIDKLKRKYSKKYSGNELDLIIKKKLYEKGYFN